MSRARHMLGEGLDPGRYGRSHIFTNVGEEATILDCKGLDDDAATVTVDLGVSRQVQGGVGAPAFVDLVGNVTWGVGGASERVEFDFIRGTSLTVSATFLRVSARYAQGANGYGWNLSALVSYGTGRQSYGLMSNLRRSFRETIGAGLPGVVTPIPEWAVGVMIMTNSVSALPTGAMVVDLLGEDGSLKVRYSPFGMTDVLPIVNDTSSVQVTNTSAVAVRVFTVFSLAL